MLIIAAFGLWGPLLLVGGMLFTGVGSNVPTSVLDGVLSLALKVGVISIVILLLYAILGKPWRRSGWERMMLFLQMPAVFLVCFGGVKALPYVEEDLKHDEAVKAVDEITAGDASALKRYQQVLRDGTHLYPSLWQWDMDKQQLHYLPAQLTFPLVKGRWVLKQVKETDQRSQPIHVSYWSVTQNGGLIKAEIRLSYDSQQDTQTPQEQLSSLQRAKAFRYHFSQALPDAALAQGMPKLPYADAVQIQYVLKDKAPDDGGLTMFWEAFWDNPLTMYWAAIRGNWHLTIRAEFLDSYRDDARAQLPVLVNDVLSWPKSVDLPGGADFEQRYKALGDEILHHGNWSEAAKSAHAELPNARFPMDIAYLRSIIGIAAYQAGDVDQASQALDIALGTWSAVGKSDYDSPLYERSLEYAAEIAAQSGHDEDAMRLTRKYVKSKGDTYFYWMLHEQVLENKRSKQVLPLRAAGFHIQPIDERRFYYENINTGQVLGLATGLPVPATEDEQERLLAHALDEQFQLDVQASHRIPYQPDTQAGSTQSVEGTKWVFDVTPQASPYARRNPAAPPIKRVIFWVVGHGETRTALRASISNDAQEEHAAEFAQALTW